MLVIANISCVISEKNGKFCENRKKSRILFIQKLSNRTTFLQKWFKVSKEEMF